MSMPTLKTLLVEAFDDTPPKIHKLTPFGGVTGMQRKTEPGGITDYDLEEIGAWLAWQLKKAPGKVANWVRSWTSKMSDSEHAQLKAIMKKHGIPEPTWRDILLGR